MWKALVMQNNGENMKTEQYQLTINTRYESLDGLRAYSALGIVLMHVLSNGKYELGGFMFDSLIPSFTNLVFLFMMVSGFSMCCGYYDKMICGEIAIADFYLKRYRRILPFFTLLCLIDFVLSPSKNSLYEIFANLTLSFGLLPKYDITVIGVGWFLGLVFVFYMLFPFYCFLLSSKKMAWFSFSVALILNHLCIVRFNAGRTNIVYCAVFFILGGIIFLYREKISQLVNKNVFLLFIVIIASAVVYYMISDTTVTMLFLYGSILMYALGKPNRRTLLNNQFVKKVSSISMEIYLSHMVIFRVLEKMSLIHLFEQDILSYIVVSFLTFCGAFLFSIVFVKILDFIFLWLRKRKV